MTCNLASGRYKDRIWSHSSETRTGSKVKQALMKEFSRESGARSREVLEVGREMAGM